MFTLPPSTLPRSISFSSTARLGPTAIDLRFNLICLGVPLRVGLSALNGKGYSARFAKPLVFLRIRYEPPPTKLS